MAQPLAVIVNPTKPVMAEVRAAVVELARERHLGQVLWYQTSRAQPGTDQARQALDQGADLVVAAGGDGTVRAVAAGLAGTTTPLGILPLGTGNLLARNLGLPLQGLRPMLKVAFDGQNRQIDVGRISAFNGPGERVLVNDVFLVIAGLGFDAIMVSATDPELKARLGWAAYFVSGMANLKGPRVRAEVAIDGRARSLSARSILVGNCGRLPAGLTLLPDATIDDGHLDIALVDTRAGLAGWASLAAKVILQGLGVRRPAPIGPGRLLHAQGTTVTIVATAPHLLELDGELIGQAQSLKIQIQPQALTVRVP